MDDLHGDEAGSNFIPCPFCLEDTFRAGHILKVKSHIKVHWDSGADVEGGHKHFVISNECNEIYLLKNVHNKNNNEERNSFSSSR